MNAITDAITGALSRRKEENINQTLHIPNPDEPEPNKASLQIFLLKKQDFHWLGPNTDIHRQKIVDVVALGPNS